MSHKERHGCSLPPLVMDSSEMGLKPTSSYKPTRDPLRTLPLTVYFTYSLTYIAKIYGNCYWHEHYSNHGDVVNFFIYNYPESKKNFVMSAGWW